MNATPRPKLGSGLGYRAGLHERTMASTAHIDWLELLAEHFLPLTPWRRRLLDQLRTAYVCVPHCLNLSVGGLGGVDESYLDALCEISALIDAPWVSDHLCFTEGDGFDFGHLTRCRGPGGPPTGRRRRPRTSSSGWAGSSCWRTSPTTSGWAASSPRRGSSSGS
ncbi:hypothetical protein GCM10018954_058650 [Kutzneria kofuensis]